MQLVGAILGAGGAHAPHQFICENSLTRSVEFCYVRNEEIEEIEIATSDHPSGRGRASADVGHGIRDAGTKMVWGWGYEMSINTIDYRKLTFSAMSWSVSRSWDDMSNSGFGVQYNKRSILPCQHTCSEQHPCSNKHYVDHPRSCNGTTTQISFIMHFRTRYYNNIIVNDNLLQRSADAVHLMMPTNQPCRRSSGEQNHAKNHHAKRT